LFPSAAFRSLLLPLVAGLLTSALGDDTQPNPPPPPATKTDAQPAKDSAPVKEGAAGKPAGEDAKAKLLALFKSEKPVTNTLQMVLEWVPAGYRVARYEVTQRDFQQVMKTNPSKFKGDMRPVENVTWEEASDFCKKLTEKEQAAGKLPKTFYYALPTEAQWDFFVDEATLKDAITSQLGDRRNTENVGGLGPNKYGLYDVRGNVWEWCSTPVARGGSWRTYEDWLVLTFRYAGSPGTRYDDIGFRYILMEQ
jgi:formylglycine-generating enzyme required for sulfatase activity